MSMIEVAQDPRSENLVTAVLKPREDPPSLYAILV
jgi:hypothetical protein